MIELTTVQTLCIVAYLCSHIVDVYRVPNVQITVFDDRAIKGNPEALEKAIDAADVVFASLIVDYDDALWLRSRIENVPLRFIFESALELMSMTQIGTFSMASSQSEKKSSGAPPIVKKVLSLFGSGREEDRLLGYLSFLKIGPKLLKFIPGTRAKDIRNWLTVYRYRKIEAINCFFVIQCCFNFSLSL